MSATIPCFADHGGVIFKTIGDAVCAASPSAPATAAAAVAAQRGLDAEAWPTSAPVRVRMALHSCDAEPEPDSDYRTLGLNRLQRILSAGHGGQVLLSEATMELARSGLPAGVFPWDLGTHRLKDLLGPERIYYNPAPPVEFGAHGIDVHVAWQAGSTITATGNSFATPHVTGLVARLLAKHPGLTVFQVKTVLRALAANMRHDER